jgi:hypothetical protein
MIAGTPVKGNKHKYTWIWAEMARRKIQFHADEPWDKIQLWGLFGWGAVSSLIKRGLLKTNMKRENRVVWVTPSPEAYEQYIRPLLETYNLQELTFMAGWSDIQGNPLNKSAAEDAVSPVSDIYNGRT